MKRALVLLLLLAPQAAAVELLDRLQLKEQRIGKRDDGRPIYAVVASLAPMRYFAAPMPYFQLGAFPGGGGGGGITIDTTTITGGATTQVLYNLAGVVSSDAGFTRSGVNGTTTISNGTGAVSPLVVMDNVTPVFTIADGGNVTLGSTNNISFSGNGSGISFGSSFGGILVRTALTPDGLQFSVGSTSNSINVYEAGDFGFDFNNGRCLTAACTNPSLIIHSPDQVTTEYLQLQVDATGGAKIQGATGEIQISKTVTLTEAGGAETVITITTVAGDSFGLELSYRVHISDATPDYAIREGSLKLVCVNKATAVSCTKDATAQTDDESVLISPATAKTLTYAIATDVATANVAKITFNVDSDIVTATVCNITYTAVLNGAGTIS